VEGSIDSAGPAIHAAAIRSKHIQPSRAGRPETPACPPVGDAFCMQHTPLDMLDALPRHNAIVPVPERRGAESAVPVQTDPGYSIQPIHGGLLCADSTQIQPGLPPGWKQRFMRSQETTGVME
jgi:hypothetical protein